MIGRLFVGKIIANLESMVSVHCITLLKRVFLVRTSCFNTDFASQMKLTKLLFVYFTVSSFAKKTLRINHALKSIKFAPDTENNFFLKCNLSYFNTLLSKYIS